MQSCKPHFFKQFVPHSVLQQVDISLDLILGDLPDVFETQLAIPYHALLHLRKV